MAKKKEIKNIDELLAEALIPKDEQPYEIPSNWEWVRLGNLGTYKKGPFGSAITKSMFVEKSDNTYKVYEQGNAIRKDLNYGHYYITAEKFKELKNFEVMPNDILVSCAGTIGEIFCLPENIERGIINQALMRIQLKNVINKDLYLMIFNSLINRSIEKESQGTAIKNIPPLKVLYDFAFPLPPLSEQTRIVNKLESMLSKIKEAKEKIAEAKESFELRRVSILHKAFTGELTRHWREEKAVDSGQLTVDSLLEKINEEKIKNWEEECKKAELEGKKKPSKPKLKTVEEMKVSDDEKPYDLPQGWEWVRFEEIFDIFVGSTPSRKRDEYWNGTINWVSSGEVAFCKIHQTKEQITKEGLNNSSTHVHPKGTVMLAMIGEGKTRGQAAILNIEAAHNQNTAAIRGLSMISDKTGNKKFLTSL